MTKLLEILKKHRWQPPANYGGYSPEGDYLIYTKWRDSRSLSRSNYECILKSLQDCVKRNNAEASIYAFRASHWAVGYVDHIVMRQSAPKAVLEHAACIFSCLEEYPVFDEDHYGELEQEAALAVWRDNYDAPERVAHMRRERGNYTGLSHMLSVARGLAWPKP